MTQNSNVKYSAFLMRLSLGTILLAHGLLKVMVFTVPGTVGYFESIGLPAIAAHFTIMGELVGGIAILVGLYTRLAAILSLPILIGAALVHASNGWVFSNQGGGWEFPVLLIVLAVSVSITGNGAYAVRKFPVIDKFIPQVLKA